MQTDTFKLFRDGVLDEEEFETYSGACYRIAMDCLEDSRQVDI